MQAIVQYYQYLKQYKLQGYIATKQQHQSPSNTKSPAISLIFYMQHQVDYLCQYLPYWDCVVKWGMRGSLVRVVKIQLIDKD